jgi:outer membrane protein assembly factor BamB
MWALPFTKSVSKDTVWVHEDIILLLAEGADLYCVRKRDGVPLWAMDLEHRPQFEPAVSDRMVYVFVRNKLVGIDRMAGQVLWRLSPEFAPSAAPCVAEPNLYVPAWDNRLYAIEIRGRERVYSTAGLARKTFSTTEHYIRSAWHKTTHGHILATPSLVEGFLYFGSEDGYVYAVSVDGEDRYRCQTQGAVRAPVVAKGAGVYAGSSDFSAYAFDRLTGSPRWILPTGSDVFQAVYPDIPSGVAIVFSYKNGVYGVVDRQTPECGSIAWRIPDAEYIAGVSEDKVYMVLTGHRLAAVEKKTGVVRCMSLLEGVREVVPNRNDWTRPDDKMRLVCLTESGHLVCLREMKEALQRAIRAR